MIYSISRSFLAFLFITILMHPLSGSSFEDQKKEKMIQDLAVIKHHLEISYAPAEWKKHYSGWSLEESFEKCKQKILDTPNITVKQFQKIVKSFLNSLNDYHVGVYFISTEQASLPFTVKGADHRYIIDWVDPLRLPPSHFPIHVGDELLEFDGQPVAQVIEELKSVEISANPMTDQRMAEMSLTHRSGCFADDAPNKAIMIKTLSSQSNKIEHCQIRWQYTPEQMINPFDFMESIDLLSKNAPFGFKNRDKKFLSLKMVNPLHLAMMGRGDRPNALGSKKGFVPPLGEIIWEPGQDESSGEFLRLFDELYGLETSDDHETGDEPNLKTDFFHSYIYQHPQGLKVGFIRVPTYSNVSKDNLKDLEKLILYYNDHTDALIIDQQNNPGGAHNIVYTIASMLTDKPLITPLHRMKLTNKIAADAYKNIAEIKKLESMLELIDQLGSDDGELNFQEILFLKAHFEFILAEWKAGRVLTNPIHLLHTDYINPHPTVRYTKPILLLINELDFSGGDFMVAIMQDANRASLFGERTAGAGGVVEKISFPNINGIKFFTYTSTIAERVGNKKIEDLGVEPDFPYQLTIEDLRDGYYDYKKAINAALEKILFPDQVKP
jgi:hypothetical protein